MVVHGPFGFPEQTKTWLSSLVLRSHLPCFMEVEVQGLGFRGCSRVWRRAAFFWGVVLQVVEACIETLPPRVSLYLVFSCRMKLPNPYAFIVVDGPSLP